MFLWKFLSILRSPGISPQNIPNGKPFQHCGLQIADLRVSQLDSVVEIYDPQS